MKKVAIAVCASVCSFMAQAGTMGAVAVDKHVIPYLEGDASYTWNSLKGTTVNSLPATLKKNGWGGRISAGIVYPYTEQFGLNAEIGGGYYGQTRATLDSRGIRAKTNIDGYDVLVGGTYHALEMVDVYFDFGFMNQNMQFKVTRDNALRFPGGLFTGTQVIHATQTQILPEIKVGALYNVFPYLAVTASYIHTFGTSNASNITTNATVSPANIANNGTIDQRNPSLNVVLFGLRYNFV